MSKFDRRKLSERENEILDLAIEGLTDAQMAQRLGIAISTVNSYWVRIRGKLGYFSRTEFVSIALRAKAKVEILELSKQTSELERQLRHQGVASAETENAYLYRTALEAIPDALLVCTQDGEIQFANDKFCSMFGYVNKEIVGSCMDGFIHSRTLLSMKRVLDTAVEKNGPLRLGVEDVLYGRRKDGFEMRIMVLLDFRLNDLTPTFSAIVRNFVDEVDVRRRFASTYALLG